MDGITSPKRLQKAGRIDEAIEYYQKRYAECLQNGDSFLSRLYLDEIAYSLIMSKKAQSLEQLLQSLTKVIGADELRGEARQQAELDIQVTLRKRFPERFKKSPRVANDN